MFCITESWLTSSIFDHEIISSDYLLYHKDRVSRGGGVVVAVHNSIQSYQIPTPLNLEILTIKFPSCDLMSCTVYIAPNFCNSYLVSVINYLSDIISAHDKCIIVGDFNLPDISWASLTCSTTLSLNFCDFIFDYNLTQHVLDPTHIKGNILDLVITSPCINITNLSITQPPNHIASDHYIVSFIPSSVFQLAGLVSSLGMYLTFLKPTTIVFPHFF